MRMKGGGELVYIIIRDTQIARLEEEIISLRKEISRSRSDLLHKISSPWCDDEDEGWR